MRRLRKKIGIRIPENYGSVPPVQKAGELNGVSELKPLPQSPGHFDAFLYATVKTDQETLEMTVEKRSAGRWGWLCLGMA
ncbi:hypothetical protein ABID12_004059 [Martelella mangrovi]|uniref:Uncharacterized protein n=1 Tax=Martelella mangrovi TaxID=1397477 RepID=A0ABV2IIN3_9HYPH